MPPLCGLAGGRAQAVMPAMGAYVNTDEASPCLSAAHFLLHSPAPSRHGLAQVDDQGLGTPIYPIKPWYPLLSGWHKERLRCAFWSSSSQSSGCL